MEHVHLKVAEDIAKKLSNGNTSLKKALCIQDLTFAKRVKKVNLVAVIEKNQLN